MFRKTGEGFEGTPWKNSGSASVHIANYGNCVHSCADTSEMVDMLGLNPHKAIIVSVVREDMTDTIMKVQEEKFRTIRNGKGVAFAVPLSSVIGVNLYRFLGNNRQ